MKTTAVIPIKQLDNAKQRLAPVLDVMERRMLFQVMVEDVLTAVEACPLIEDIIVVTSDADVADLAHQYGALVLAEPSEPGLIPAVTSTGEYLANSGADAMLFLPGDIPLITAEELEVVLEGFGRQDEAEFLIVPASDLGGSNCVICSPPDCMTFEFGEDSFRRHLAVARKRGIEPVVVKLPGIGLDIDVADDLSELIEVLAASEIESYTHRYLRASGINTRELGGDCSSEDCNEPPL